MNFVKTIFLHSVASLSGRIQTYHALPNPGLSSCLYNEDDWGNAHREKIRSPLYPKKTPHIFLKIPCVY